MNKSPSIKKSPSLKKVPVAIEPYARKTLKTKKKWDPETEIKYDDENYQYMQSSNQKYPSNELNEDNLHQVFADKIDSANKYYQPKDQF